jgi:hypothetical protein
LLIMLFYRLFSLLEPFDGLGNSLICYQCPKLTIHF